MIRRFVFRLFILVLVFAGGLIVGADIVSKGSRSADVKVMDGRESLPAAKENQAGAGTAGSTNNTSSTSNTGNAGSAIHTNTAAHANGQVNPVPAGGNPFRPEPGLHVKESFLNKLLTKTGDAVRLLAEGLLKAVVALLDGVLG